MASQPVDFEAIDNLHLQSPQEACYTTVWMKKAAAQRDETTTAAQDELDRKLQSINTRAKQQFFGATFTLGWRLAITVLIPLIAGIKLDQHFHTSPSYTLAGFMIAAAAGASAVWSTVKEVDKEQEQQAKEEEEKRAQ